MSQNVERSLLWCGRAAAARLLAAGRLARRHRLLAGRFALRVLAGALLRPPLVLGLLLAARIPRDPLIAAAFAGVLLPARRIVAALPFADFGCVLCCAHDCL